MKLFYRILAEVTGIIHGIVFIGALLVGLLWEVLFWFYTIGFLLGVLSWLILGRCFVTDIENYLRIKAGQDISHIKKSFLGYWGVKAFGEYGPSNNTITRLILGFYSVITPIWIYILYSRYFYSI